MTTSHKQEGKTTGGIKWKRDPEDGQWIVPARWLHAVPGGLDAIPHRLTLLLTVSGAVFIFSGDPGEYRVSVASPRHPCAKRSTRVR